MEHTLETLYEELKKYNEIVREEGYKQYNFQPATFGEAPALKVTISGKNAPNPIVIYGLISDGSCLGYKERNLVDYKQAAKVYRHALKILEKEIEKREFEHSLKVLKAAVDKTLNTAEEDTSRIEQILDELMK